MVKAIIVEDNAVYRQSLRDILHSRFPTIDFTEATNGEEAMEKIDAFSPEIIFLDIELPEESGLSLTKKIKAGHPNAYVIILTNYDLPEYRAVAYQSGANYFLSKDSSAAVFFALVESLLSA